MIEFFCLVQKIIIASVFIGVIIAIIFELIIVWGQVSELC